MWRTTGKLEKCGLHLEISIHVPRVEDDAYRSASFYNYKKFQSTSPVWRTTAEIDSFIGSMPISIHVPRVEDDKSSSFVWGLCSDFNPRPPCGGRRIGQRHSTIIKNFNPRPPCGGRLSGDSASKSQSEFQSTSPVWRTTHTGRFRFIHFSISIHVPRVEDDA